MKFANWMEHPLSRPRRMRANPPSRSLLRETYFGVDKLIYPVFVCEGANILIDVKSMPGIKRRSLDTLLVHLEEVAALGIPGIAIFPAIDPSKKSLDAKEAFRPEGLVPTCVREIKKRFPELLIITDVALDPYTLHGQDGVMDDRDYVDNDKTIAILTKQALCHAQAGADIVAPSDMMDGRIRAIRLSLEEASFHRTQILAYTAKYASAFYGPFREAVASAQALGKADKKTYQMDPANTDEAIREATMDIAEGADMIMVKPGSLYLDIIWRLKEQFRFPTFAYHVSGEYAMLKAAGASGYIDEKECVLETMTAFRRAGCDAVLTYYAVEVARWLRSC